MSQISINRLREVLHYDPKTGIFRWRITLSNRNQAGAIAGSPHIKGYVSIGIDGRKYLAHCLAWAYMTGTWPSMQVDHEDTGRSNNRWRNLREATGSQNLANSKKPKTNTSGFKGVSWNKQSQRWLAQIKVNGRGIFLGRFDTTEEAHSAYVAAANRYYSKFARAA